VVFGLMFTVCDNSNDNNGGANSFPSAYHNTTWERSLTGQVITWEIKNDTAVRTSKNLGGDLASYVDTYKIDNEIFTNLPPNYDKGFSVSVIGNKNDVLAFNPTSIFFKNDGSGFTDSTGNTFTKK